ncbi:MAG: sigma 54-interacting transcriptional regulator, partial [Planctomycetota bacterium]
MTDTAAPAIGRATPTNGVSDSEAPSAAPAAARLRGLLVYADTAARNALADRLRAIEVRTDARSGLRDAAAAGADPDVLFLDLHHQEDGIDDVLSEASSLFPQSPIIGVSSSLSLATVRGTLDRGAFDAIRIDADEASLFAATRRAAAHAQALRKLSRMGATPNDDALTGDSPAIQAIRRIVHHVATLDVHVMVTGETGIEGADIAGAVHRRSRRAAGPFVSVRLADVPADLVGPTLLGSGDRPGAIQQANGGTLFLEDVTELDPEHQLALLEVLLNGAYRQGDSETQSDVRIVAGASRDPASAARSGRLNADLHHRLSLTPIPVPPLRDRREDIRPLALRALTRAATGARKSFTTITPEALSLLESHSWPGNVRELRDLIERAVARHEGPELTVSMLPIELLGAARDAQDARSTRTARRTNGASALGAHAP